MLFDLQGARDASTVNVALMREHAIYRATQTSDRRVHKARNVADMLERGHRGRAGQHTAVVIDLMA